MLYQLDWLELIHQSTWGKVSCILCLCVTVSVWTSSVGLWDFQNSVNHKEEPRKAKDLCKDKIWSFFVFWLSLLLYVDQFIYLMLLMDFKSSCQKKSIQKIYLGKNLEVAVFYFCYGHTSLKRERIFHWIAIFATTITIFMSVNKK